MDRARAPRDAVSRAGDLKGRAGATLLVTPGDVETFGDATEPYGLVDGEGVANQFRRLVQMVRVKKGQRVTFTFKARGFDDPAQDY